MLWLQEMSNYRLSCDTMEHKSEEITLEEVCANTANTELSLCSDEYDDSNTKEDDVSEKPKEYTEDQWGQEVHFRVWEPTFVSGFKVFTRKEINRGKFRFLNTEIQNGGKEVETEITVDDFKDPFNNGQEGKGRQVKGNAHLNLWALSPQNKRNGDSWRKKSHIK
jgi:hypothetical protein